MQTTYFVTATNTDVGKTYACEVFLKQLAKQGKKVGYFKPCETGVVEYPMDGSKMLDLVKQLNPSFDVSIDDVVPYQFNLPAAPYVANSQDIDIDISFLKQKAKYLLNFCDVLVVEGAGGLMVPLKESYFIIDLIKDFQDEFNQKTKLITPSKLGSINDTLLSQAMLEQREINYEWYINLYQDKDSFDEVTLPFYRKYFGENLKYL